MSRLLSFDTLKRIEDRHPVATYLLGGLALGAALGAAYLGLQDTIYQGVEAGAEIGLDAAGFVLREVGVLPIDIAPVIDPR